MEFHHFWNFPLLFFSRRQEGQQNFPAKIFQLFQQLLSSAILLFFCWMLKKWRKFHLEKQKPGLSFLKNKKNGKKKNMKKNNCKKLDF